jgi:ubiquinone/menaquinone biosynthesis C-methylase UbiE
MLTSRDDVERQYQTPDNLAARAAIYRFATPQTPWSRWVFDQFHDLPANARVLEVGCGSGALWKQNLDRLHPTWRVTLLDLSAGMLAAARRDLPFELVRGDAEHLPFAVQSFDAVVANHMLYHLADLPRALAEIRRVLTAGGKLFATTNSESHLSRMKELINHFLADGSPLVGPMPFSLENGEPQLRRLFASVEIRTTRGQLRVTDAEAIVRYVLSVNEAPKLMTGEKLDELRRVAREGVGRNGAFVLETAAGMFVATAAA